MIVWTLAGTSAFFAIVAGWSLYVQYKVRDKLETELIDIYARLSVTLMLMRQIDVRQMFESDDEVGMVFQQLSALVQSLGVMIGESNDPSQQTFPP